jgi:hypothetical protein
MTAPGKTSSRAAEDEPPPHGNSSPGPDGASEIHPAAWSINRIVAGSRTRTQASQVPDQAIPAGEPAG